MTGKGIRMLQNIIALNTKSKTLGYLAVDFLVICFVYLLPSLSHLTSIPFYLFDPMRLALIFCIITTGRKNSILIALTLPLVSILISSHPAVVKGLLISAELSLNVFLFYFFSKRWSNLFVSMFVSIFFAKVFYYSVKIVLLNYNLIQGELISTPLWIQGLMMVVLSLCVLIIARKDAKNAKEY